MVSRYLMGSDEQLMLKFQKGSAEAFTELFERYREPIYSFFRRRLQDAARRGARAKGPGASSCGTFRILPKYIGGAMAGCEKP